LADYAVDAVLMTKATGEAGGVEILPLEKA